MTIAPPAPTALENLKQRLLTDDRFWIEGLAQIVTQQEELIPLKGSLKPVQLRLLEKKAEQEAEGKPVRIIVLKARRGGVSTLVQSLMVKRVTQRRNHKALVVAHDGKTAKELFEMGETMYSQLPDEVIAGLQLKPKVRGSRKGTELRLGEPSAARRLAGDLGLNSSYLVDTANEFEAGRGFTYHSLHLSEFAFWGQPGKKLAALMQTLPEGPESMCVIECTANGYNLFRKLWVKALSGKDDYYPLFMPWFEEPGYSLPFLDDEERDTFAATVGEGEYGAGEPELLEKEATLEQLKWRRWAISNKAFGDIRTFMQEYPSNWEEAFLSSGRTVFEPARVAKIFEHAETADPEAERGIIRPTEMVVREHLGSRIEIPQKPVWIPEDTPQAGIGALWKRWEAPFLGTGAWVDEDGFEQPAVPPGQYVLNLDSASGAETTSEGQDYFCIQVINHRTLAQVAEWRARGIDPDLATKQLYMAAMLYAPEFAPWVSVEVTGGYGVSIAMRMYKVFRYGKMFFRTPAERKKEKQQDRLGFSMDVSTKPVVVDGAKELIRLGRDGIHSMVTASEAQTYVRDEKGRMGAEEDYFDDSLESWMVAQYVAAQKPVQRSKVGLPAAALRPKVHAPTMRARPRNTRYGQRG